MDVTETVKTLDKKLFALLVASLEASHYLNDDVEHEIVWPRRLAVRTQMVLIKARPRRWRSSLMAIGSVKGES